MQETIGWLCWSLSELTNKAYVLNNKYYNIYVKTLVKVAR